MSGKRIVLIGGGTRSGKTAFAMKMASRLGEMPAFVGTSSGVDDETKKQIERCRAERGNHFANFEEPIALVERLEMLGDHDIVIVDSIDNWISNLLLRKYSVDNVLGQVDRLATVLLARRFHAILVSSEVGMTFDPPTAADRSSVQVTVDTHQRLARVCDELYLAAMGIVRPIRRSEFPIPARA